MCILKNHEVKFCQGRPYFVRITAVSRVVSNYLEANYMN